MNREKTKEISVSLFHPVNLRAMHPEHDDFADSRPHQILMALREGPQMEVADRGTVSTSRRSRVSRTIPGRGLDHP